VTTSSQWVASRSTAVERRPQGPRARCLWQGRREDPASLANQQVFDLAAEGGEVGVGGEFGASVGAVFEAVVAPEVDQCVQLAHFSGVEAEQVAEYGSVAPCRIRPTGGRTGLPRLV